eukprot:TRINITY_DN16713_c0_g1_i1.p1 TRINITY_DN16713_c0_g1~~TRINITY_DN16713_c0_g1_i1.p1  ORF type:complete len:186 (+),score=12.35 TRINITY_DN16713_c0_g1_i1:42-560(+)
MPSSPAIDAAIEVVTQAQEALLKAIVEDEEASSLTKLSLLEEHKLFRISDYIADEFEEWKMEAISRVREATGNPKATVQCDGLWDPSQIIDGCTYRKGQTCTYSTLIDVLIDKAMSANPGAAMDVSYVPIVDVVVITVRGSDVVIKKPLIEVIDHVFKFCVAKKTIGFTLDW